jgi:hypothetical protein
MIPFTNEEIESVMKNIRTDRALGPDGFNGFLTKKCWTTIKEDFIKLDNDFYSGNMNLDSILLLFPKINNPENMYDYRPISLVNLPLKFITKLMANRMQKEIIPILPVISMASSKGKPFKTILDGHSSIDIFATYP